MNSVSNNHMPPNNMPSIYFGDGQFEFITTLHSRRMLCSAHRAITQLELWNWMRNTKPDKDKGYMWWSHLNMERIMYEIENDYVGHSGSSFAITMRHMKYIADHGYDAYMMKIVANVEFM